MLIECPFCHRQANLPESQEGAKVRCPGCRKLYRARARGAAGRASSGPTPTQVALGAAVVAAVFIVVVIVSRSREDAPKPPAVVEAAEPEVHAPVDFSGWDSAPVQAVRTIYDAALRQDEVRLMGLLDAERIAARLAAPADEGQDPEAQPAAAPEPLDSVGREQLLRAAARELLEGEDDGETVARLWKPYDGSVVEETDTSAVVHLVVAGRDPALASLSHTIEWRLVRDGDAWRAWSWEKWVPPDQRARPRNKEITRVELDDGTRLYQADPRPLPHLDDTPEGVRARIDTAAARLIDFTLHPRENNAANAELVEIGKPAIPILLTKLYETRIVDDQTLAKVGRLHLCLRDITGYDPGFSVTALGPDSDAKREIAVKAWFAWWLRKGERRFEEKEEGVDLLDQLLEGEQPEAPRRRRR